MRFLVLVAFVSGASFLPAIRASAAAFSEDGRTLWVSSDLVPEKMMLAYKAGSEIPVKIPWPKAIAKEGGAHLIAADPPGILLATDKAVWHWNPAKPEIDPESLAPLPVKFSPDTLCRAPGGDLEGAVFITGGYHFDEDHPKPKNFDDSETFFGLKRGGKTFGPVFVRRVDEMTGGPAFYKDRMVFGGNGDIWEGGIASEDNPIVRPWTLWGHRSAPLALMNTDGFNSGSLTVREVVIAGGTVWAGLFGHHMSALVTVPLEKKPASNDQSDFAETWKNAGEQLSRCKVVTLPDEAEFGADLCAWTGPDGEWKVAFFCHGRSYWQFEKGAKAPRKIGTEPVN